MSSSTLRIGPASLVRGSSVIVQPYGIAYGYAYTSIGSASLNTVYLDPRYYAAQLPTPGPPTTPAVIDAAFHDVLVAGYPYGLTVSGPAGGFALLMLGERRPAPTPVPFGTLAFEPSTAIPLDLVYLPPPGGHFGWSLQCPAEAPVGARPFVFQALTLSPNGQFGVTVPSPFTVGWQHGVVPFVGSEHGVVQ
jgi:hypothetical protein